MRTGNVAKGKGHFAEFTAQWGVNCVQDCSAWRGPTFQVPHGEIWDGGEGMGPGRREGVSSHCALPGTGAKRSYLLFTPQWTRSKHPAPQHTCGQKKCLGKYFANTKRCVTQTAFTKGCQLIDDPGGNRFILCYQPSVKYWQRLRDLGEMPAGENSACFMLIKLSPAIPSQIYTNPTTVGHTETPRLISSVRPKTYHPDLLYRQGIWNQNFVLFLRYIILGLHW